MSISLNIALAMQFSRHGGVKWSVSLLSHKKTHTSSVALCQPDASHPVSLWASSALRICTCILATVSVTGTLTVSSVPLMSKPGYVQLKYLPKGQVESKKSNQHQWSGWWESEARLPASVLCCLLHEPQACSSDGIVWGGELIAHGHSWFFVITESLQRFAIPIGVLIW